MEKLTWHTAAGGTFAADDKHSYFAFHSHGEYKVWPVSHKFNVNKHLGYRVYFCNTKGVNSNGLWQPLSQKLVSLRAAIKLCKQHWQEIIKLPLPDFTKS